MSYSSKNMNHLGIVSGIFDLLQIQEVIDTELPSEQRNVSHGEAVKAMVLNALGFTSRALYLTGEFFKTKPIELIREGLSPEELNDDSLGRSLDRLHQAGVTELFSKVVTRAMEVLQREATIAHLDSTTFSLSGAYHTEGQAEPGVIELKKGHSKDHRPDQVQAGLVLICDHITRIPLWMESVSGNSSDKKQLSETLRAFKEQLQDSSPLIVMDSAFYSAANLVTHQDSSWISRPPLTLQKSKELLKRAAAEDWSEAEVELIYQEYPFEYAGISQRCFAVFSKGKKARDEKQLEKTLKREQERLIKQLKALKARSFDCEGDARQAAQEIEKKLNFHRFTELRIGERSHYGRSGRPKAGKAPERLTYHVEIGFEQHEAKLIEERKSHGLYLLATNELDTERYPAERIIRTYKAQGSTVERGFRFLKDPMFFAGPLFLKSPSRIMALMMVMTLSLLVYSAAEFLMRQRLEEAGETVPNQVGRETSTPTLRRVFQVFEGIDVLLIDEGERIQRLILNLRPEHHRLLRFMEPQVQALYLGARSP